MMNRNNDAAQSPDAIKNNRLFMGAENWWFILVFVFCTFFFCYPIFVHPTYHLAEHPLGDKGTNLWNLWWVYYALFVKKISPLFSTIVFYPWGCDLRYHTLSIVNGLIAAPITHAVGPNISYNFLFALWTILTGIFAAKWGRLFGLSFWGAVLLGFIAAFNPFRWAHLEHLNLFSTAWLFLAFYSCESMIRQEKGAFGIILFTISWLLALFTDWYFGLFIGMYFAVRVFFLIPKSRISFTRLLNIVLIPSIVILFSVFLYFQNSDPSFRADVPVDEVEMKYAAYWSLDLIHWIMPLWLVDLIEIPVRVEGEFRVHPGVFWMLLGIGSLLFSKKLQLNPENVRFLRAAIIVFFVLSAGPVLQWQGEPVSILGIPIFLPATLFEFVPALTSIRVFARFSLIGFLLLSLLGILSLEKIFRRYSRGLKYCIYIFCALLFLVETQWWFPKMIQYSPRSELYSGLSRPVLEVPFTPSFLSGLHLYHQTIHHQPIYVAEFSRLSHYKERYLNAYPTLSLFNQLAHGEKFSPNDMKFSQEDFVKEFRRLGSFELVVGGISPLGGQAEEVRNNLRKLLERIPKGLVKTKLKVPIQE